MRASSGFTRGGKPRRCETWIVLELCSLGSLQARARSSGLHWRACMVDTAKCCTQHAC